MYKHLLVLFIGMFFGGKIDAQSIDQVLDKSKMVLFDQNKLKPFSSVRITVDIQTDKGKFPATILLLEGMKYKLEMTTPKGVYTRAMDMLEYSVFDPEMKISEQFQRQTPEYFSNNHLLYFYPIMGLSQRNNSESIVEFRGEAMEDNMIYTTMLQRMLGSEMIKTFYYNFVNGELHKIVIAQNEIELEGNNKLALLYKKYTKSKEGYIYPSTFTTPLGEATVKTIEFNAKLTEKEFNTNLHKF